MRQKWKKIKEMLIFKSCLLKVKMLYYRKASWYKYDYGKLLPKHTEDFHGKGPAFCLYTGNLERGHERHHELLQTYGPVKDPV